MFAEKGCLNSKIQIKITLLTLMNTHIYILSLQLTSLQLNLLLTN